MRHQINKIRTALWLIIFMLVFSYPVFAQYSEIEVKAAYLERFTRFIEWPENSTMSDTTQPFVLGILGKNPFGSILEDVYKTQKIKNKNVEIQYYSDMTQIEQCNLLFIAGSEENNLLSILAQINEDPILTISDSKDFAEKGVQIGLYRKDNTLHYEINETAIMKSGFTVWAQLLSSAKIISPVKR